jgi:DNA (cytosine-5)-methyltransferase 1
MTKRLTVIDFFCGAGGFSEGFRQAGYDVVMGVDNWLPAVTTHNINHGLSDIPISVLEFEDIKKIEELPDTDVIVGSPPCVSFSLSNKGGGSDKTLGIRLIEAYLRIVAIKKHKKGSVLKAWLMENVPNSRHYVKQSYTFADLGLGEWAASNSLKPKALALNVSNNGEVLKASDYGAAQSRSRFVCGEIIFNESFPLPEKTHSNLTVRDIRQSLPAPMLQCRANLKIKDPNYPNRTFSCNELHDHFYDTGVYEVEWQKARVAKLNHPYMGRMSFPENEAKPSRTIMATRSASTREAIIYESELKRQGDGQYRTPTVREAASMMGFPLDYEFYGDESKKWRQVGNAVCVPLSFKLAQEVINRLNLKAMGSKEVKKDLSSIEFLDNQTHTRFDKPPKRNPKALFRMHPIKSGNMTVDLTNRSKDIKDGWGVVAHAGTGRGYRSVQIRLSHKSAAKKILSKECPQFLEGLESAVGVVRYTQAELDKKNEEYGYTSADKTHPYNIIKLISEYINKFRKVETNLDVAGTALYEIKSVIPLSQAMSIYAMGVLFSVKHKQ